MWCSASRRGEGTLPRGRLADKSLAQTAERFKTGGSRMAGIIEIAAWIAVLLGVAVALGIIWPRGSGKM
jgi:hypothetical protein